MTQPNEDFEKKLAEQYSLRKIIAIWILAAAPMAILSQIISPMLTPIIGNIFNAPSENVAFAISRFLVITFGLIWLFVFSMIIVYLEHGNLKLSTIKARLWLTTPTDPKTGAKNMKLFYWAMPLLVLVFLLSGLTGIFTQLTIDFFKVDPRLLPETAFAGEYATFFEGAYWFLVVAFIMAIFNTVLGEEFLLRGVLLPKMEGEFGRWDWVVNGILMGAYHWHQPWMIPSGIIISILCFSYPAKRFKSIWFSFIVHSLQSVLLMFLVSGLVFGMT